MARICFKGWPCADSDFLCSGGFGSLMRGGGTFFGEERDDGYSFIWYVSSLVASLGAGEIGEVMLGL